MAVLKKPSINAFSLLESDDPGHTYLGDVGAPSKVDAAASRPVNINKKQQQPQMSAWKANKVKAEANAAKNKNKQQQPAASKAKTNSSAATACGRNRKPQQLAASKVQPSTAAANAGKHKKPQQPAAASRAQAKTAANAAADEQFQRHPPAPVNFTQILFGNAYPSARALIYKNRKQNATADAKEGGASGATTDDKSGVHANGAAVKDDDCPAPPSLDDSAQFPSLK